MYARSIVGQHRCQVSLIHHVGSRHLPLSPRQCDPTIHLPLLPCLGRIVRALHERVHHLLLRSVRSTIRTSPSIPQEPDQDGDRHVAQVDADHRYTHHTLVRSRSQGEDVDVRSHW